LSELPPMAAFWTAKIFSTLPRLQDRDRASLFVINDHIGNQRLGNQKLLARTASESRGKEAPMFGGISVEQAHGVGRDRSRQGDISAQQKFEW
jgi:hypothetical protein